MHPLFSMSDPVIIPCGPTVSLFKEVVDPFWPDLQTRPAFHRICTLMRMMGVQSVIVENLDVDESSNTRFLIEKKAIRTRLKKHVEVTFKRLTFLTTVPTMVGRKVKGFTDTDLLGFVVVATITPTGSAGRTYVFESVVREVGKNPTEQRNVWASYLHVQRQFRIAVQGQTYEITGTYFCQQNTITNVCAHACTAMLLNNCVDVENLVTCETINKLLGIDHKHRMQEVLWGGVDNSLATHEGLQPQEVERVLRGYNFTTFRNRSGGVKSVPHRDFVYSFIESGYPSLVTFCSQGGNGNALVHVVTVVGHSLNKQSWFPAVQSCYCKSWIGDRTYLGSLNWVDDFLVHDDNFGMQLYVPANTFGSPAFATGGLESNPSLAIGILPAEANVVVYGDMVEFAAWSALQALFDGEEDKVAALETNYYVKHLRPHVTGEDNHPQTAVLRALLLKREDYLNQLANQVDKRTQATLHQSDIAKIRELLIPHPHIWVVEVTEPELYVGNTTRVMDVLIDPKVRALKPEYLKEGFAALPIAVRLPHMLLKTQIGDRGQIQFSKIDAYSGGEGHLPLLKSCNKGKILDMTK